MILCICKAVSDTVIKDLVNQGLSQKEIIEKTGICKECKICVPAFKKLYEDK
jgi:bacterioferritin-associated ferredoxin